jgi:hypothetical protein
VSGYTEDTGSPGQGSGFGQGGSGSVEKEQHVVPFIARLPRIPLILWQRIDQALANLDDCMAPPPDAGRIEADADQGYALTGCLQSWGVEPGERRKALDEATRRAVLALVEGGLPLDCKAGILALVRSSNKTSPLPGTAPIPGGFVRACEGGGE